MALVSIARHGYSAAGGNMDGVPPQGRGGSRGWSKRSRKSNEEFLQSIDFHGLSGIPYAVTLTLPTTRTPDSTEFHAMLKAYLMRLKRYGAIRWHWLIEWTMKHQPHTHMVVWAPADWIFFEVDARVMWLEIAKNMASSAGLLLRTLSVSPPWVGSSMWLSMARSPYMPLSVKICPLWAGKLPVGSGDMAPALHGLLRPLVSLCALTCPNLRSGV